MPSTTQPKPRCRTLAAVFLLLSAGLSIAILAKRNLYDDEISAFQRITPTAAQIVRITAATDIHPPGMYVLAHFAWCVIPSFRWLNLFPMLFVYTGLAAFLLQVTPLFSRAGPRLCLLVLATLHPQLLMWGQTFRWYGWWTGIAVIAVTITLQPGQARPDFGPARGAVVGVLLGALFYLNFITFLFVAALGAAMVLRYGSRTRLQLVLSSALALSIFGVLILPGLPMLFGDMPAAQGQRSPLSESALRLVQGAALSEAYLPWHPLAMVAGLVFTMLCVAGVLALFRRRRALPVPTEVASARAHALASLAVFALVFAALVAISGLGGKPRNALVLIPVLAPVVAWVVETLRPRVQAAIVLFYLLWAGVGTAHMLGRYGLAKASMIDRPEQVVDFVRDTTGPNCAVVVTHDVTLAFSLTQSDLPRLLIVSPYRESTLGGSTALPESDCHRTMLYVVHSYSGADGSGAATPEAELALALGFFEGTPGTHYFSFDPDAARKRSLASLPRIGAHLSAAAQLPDYRYVVAAGPMDRSRIPEMRRLLSDYVSGTQAEDAR